MNIRRLILALGLLVVLAAVPVAAAPAGHVEGFVLVAAHGGGLFNSFWTTDLWIYTESATVIHLWYNPSGNDNTNVQSVDVPLSQATTFLPDVVANTFHAQGKGSIHYLADGEVIVVSRTWTPGQSGGTYGQISYGLPASMAAMPDSGPGGSLRMLANQRAGFRDNLGLVNASPNAVTATVEIFTAAGQPASGTSSFTVALQPYDMQQVDDILSRLTAGTQTGLIVRVSVTSGNGAVLAYLSEEKPMRATGIRGFFGANCDPAKAAEAARKALTGK